MQTECEHALMLNKIKSHLPSNVIKRLEERVMEENIGHAEIEGLQRCQKCNYAVEVIGGRYFICICGHKQCIKCGDPFDNKKHNDFTCANKKRKEEQTVDDQINDVVVRFCHKCKLQFVKSSGCNFMKCR
uniref:RING-type domain-containing protein n=1 Tax=Panagrolaimus superbus TaxID=310955 RepID=A0A914YLU9_9BILA